MENITDANIFGCELLTRWRVLKVDRDDLTSVNAVLNVFLTINLLILVTSAVGNFVVAMALWKIQSLQEPSMFLLFCLSTVDLFHALTSQILFCATLITFAIDRHQNLFSYGCFFNTGSILTSLLFNGTSFLMVTAIAVDKYLALKLHLRYSECVTRKRTKCVVISSFFIGSALVAARMFNNGNIFEVLLFFVLMAGIVVTLLTSAMVHWSVRKHRKKILSQQLNFAQRCPNLGKHKRSANTTLYVMTACIVCFLPYTTVFPLARKSVLEANVATAMYVIARTLLNANSAINPFLYCYRLRRIRCIVMELLRNAFSFFLSSRALS